MVERIEFVEDKVNVTSPHISNITWNLWHLYLLETVRWGSEHCAELEDSHVEAEDSIHHEVEEELEYAAIAYLVLPVALHASSPVVPGFDIAAVVEEQLYEP